jgi:transcriptional regulator with AAA-type ATPase domain
MKKQNLNEQAPGLHILVAGEGDLVRRLNAFFSREEKLRSLPQQITFSLGSTAELKSLCLSLRPDILLVEVGLRSTAQDVFWLKTRLIELRQRFGRRLYIILAVSSPERCFLAGSLLFAEDTSLSPSGLINDMLAMPPPSIAEVPSIEDQLLNALHFAAEILVPDPGKKIEPPAFWDDNWVPAMADPSSRQVWLRWLPRYARYTNENPLIIGPTGSGKTRLAAALHQLSLRAGPFVSITPRDFSNPELVQAELFGAVPGAYTGAVEKWGLVKKAEQGTLFVDELQSIDFDLQGKLITFIESKSYRRVGESASNQADVRFVFASNKPLAQLVQEGKLRDDFAYRLERLQIDLKPLSLRRLDIAAGMCFAGAKIIRERTISSTPGKGASSHADIEGCSIGAYNQILLADWPGNLRQLENTLARLIELSSISGLHLIDEHCTAEALTNVLGSQPSSAQSIYLEAFSKVMLHAQSKGKSLSLGELLSALEEQIRATALVTSGTKSEVAAQLIGESPESLELFRAARVKL